MNSKEEKFNLQQTMSFYWSTINLFNHFSTTRYWIWALFFILSFLSGKEMLNNDINIEARGLFATSALVFLIMTYIGNGVFINAVRNKANIIYNIEDKVFSKYYKGIISESEEQNKSTFTSDKMKVKLIKIEKLNKRTRRYFGYFNFMVWLILIVYTILLIYNICNIW